MPKLHGTRTVRGEVTLHMAYGAVVPFSGVSYVRCLSALWYCSSKIWLRVRPAREARGHHKNEASFYSCLLISSLGDFPRLSLLSTRQKERRHLICLLTSLAAGLISKDMGHVITSYLGWFRYSPAQTETGRCVTMLLSFPRGPKLRIWPLIFPGIHKARRLSHSSYCGEAWPRELSALTWGSFSCHCMTCKLGRKPRVRHWC